MALVKRNKRQYSITIKLIETQNLPVESFNSLEKARTEATNRMRKNKNLQFTPVRILSLKYETHKICSKCQFKMKVEFNFCPKCGENTKENIK